MSNRNAANFSEITNKRKDTWSAGDFNQIARQNWVMAEALCDSIDPHPAQQVLDIACGSGTAALVFERRYCDVTGIDFVPELIKRARLRAEANGQNIEFKVGDVQQMPFPDETFDVVVSVYGVQFAPDQSRAASEMLRVCKSGGIIGLAGPIPEGWSGDFFKTHANYVPPPPGIQSPMRWGTDEGLSELLGRDCSSVKTSKRTALQYYRSTDHAIEVFSKWFGPTIRASEKLADNERNQFISDLKKVFDRYNRAKDGTAIVENTYLQTIAQKR